MGTKTVFSDEIENIFINANNKEYVHKNIKSLKNFFSDSDNIFLLRLALTTKRNISALKIIQKINIPITPLLFINRYTYISLYNLYKMKMVDSDFFEQHKRKFMLLNNFESLCNEVEQNFIRLQIEKQKRRMVRSSLEINNYIFWEYENRVAFIFLLDNIISVDVEHFQVDNIQTFYNYDNDINKVIKFKDFKNQLLSSNIKGFSYFHNLEKEEKSKIENVLWLISRIKKTGFKYFIVSRKPLSKILSIIFLYFQCLDYCKIFHIPESNLSEIKNVFSNIEKNTRIIIMDDNLLKYTKIIGENLLENKKSISE